MLRFALACTMTLLSALNAPAADVPDGIYPLGGNGPRIKLSGGGDATLGPLRTDAWERAEVVSLANDNARFAVHLRTVDPAVDRGEPATVVLVVNGMGMSLNSRAQHADGKLDLS